MKKSLPCVRGGGLQSNSDEVKSNYDCFRNLHLTTACGGASPQGEAFERFALKPYVFQDVYQIAQNAEKQFFVVPKGLNNK